MQLAVLAVIYRCCRGKTLTSHYGGLSTAQVWSCVPTNTIGYNVLFAALCESYCLVGVSPLRVLRSGGYH